MTHGAIRAALRKQSLFSHKKDDGGWMAIMDSACLFSGQGSCPSRKTVRRSACQTPFGSLWSGGIMAPLSAARPRTRPWGGRRKCATTGWTCTVSQAPLRGSLDVPEEGGFPSACSLLLISVPLPPLSPVAPTVRIVPPPGILREGDSLSLVCLVTGNPL